MHDYEVLIVCEGCDAAHPEETSVCEACGHLLESFEPAPAEAETSATSEGESARSSTPSAKSTIKRPHSRLSQEELMEQARNYLCLECQTPVPTGHKFCGRCGQVVPPSVLEARTAYFSDVQDPAKARLILVRGEGLEGLSFHLKAESHTLGRTGQIAFPDDPFVSPKHASFAYRDAKLVVTDEGSLNGIYVRIRGTVAIAPGDMFLAGDQVFRLDEAPTLPNPTDADGTVFYVSPAPPTTFRITQLLQGGAPGLEIGARSNVLQIGRFDCDLNFPDDAFLSSAHCKVEESGGGYLLTDLNSRNGTYLRIASERELAHGDYLFFGRKLLRVEMNVS